ncbi:hypothetical protein [Dactylosporangium darangshiense]|uniref:Uncharacterized protein n=1 Tax=Dactylosporangium darangshiense TaxID=579108 RepID=A0ABP8DUE2_9ACTN
MRIECDVTYEAGSGRLIGGDFLRSVGSGWARSFLMPAGHATRLWNALQRLDDAYRRDNELPAGAPGPYPGTLAVITPGGLPGAIDGRPQLVPLELAFGATQLRDAPPEYRDPAQLVCAVTGPDTLADRGPAGSAERRALATNLFGALTSVHRRLYAALTRPTGSSVDRSTVSPAGHLHDVYFLTLPGDRPGVELRRGQRQDVTRALRLLLDAGSTRDDLHEAAAAYCGIRPIPADIVALADRAVAGPPEAVADLAEAMLTTGW